MCESWTAQRPAANAALTRAAVNGTRRRRTPVASKTAFPNAPATGTVAASPAPHKASSRRSIRITSTAGASENFRIGYVDQSTLVTRDSSNCTSSCSARLSVWTIPPSI